MSFEDCINAKVGSGKISKSKADALLRDYEDLKARYTESMGDAQAAATASAKIYMVKAEVIGKKVENEMAAAMAQITIRKSLAERAAAIEADKDSAKVGKWLFGHPYARAVREKMERTYIRQQALEREAHAMIAELVEEFRSKRAGLQQNVTGFLDVVREVGGRSTGNEAASAYGKALRKTFDHLHAMFEDAGGIIGKLDNWFPQVHTPELVGRASFEEWRDFIKPLLDVERMTDADTGLPLTAARLDDAMREAYEGIRTNGLDDVAQRAREGKQTIGRPSEISMRRTSSRFFHFKDTEAFLAYNRQFGVGDAGLFDGVMRHISTMTRDIAVLQDFGPKPGAMMKNLELEMQGRKASGATVSVVKGMFDVLAGRTSYGGELPPWYKFFSGWMNLKRSAYLGSAPVSAMADSYYINFAARANGLPAMKVMGRYLKMLNPANDADRRAARRLFFVASAANGMGLKGARFVEDIERGGWTAWLANFTNRGSGLAAMTDAGQAAPAMELAGVLNEMQIARKGWNDIDPALREAAEAWGIDSADWQRFMKASATYADEVDAHFLLPEDVARLGPDSVESARKLSEWMTGMGQLAVNEPTLLTRSITTGAAFGDGRQGSLVRLVTSNVFFAKSFPITVMINHLFPALREAAQGRGQRLAGLAVGSAVFGAAAMQARQVITGKDPRDMTTPDFWVAASLQGGGLGLFGDFMFGDHNRFGGSLGATLAGPVVGTTESLLKIGDLDSLGTDADFEGMLADTWRVVSREVPAVRLWYTRLVVERLMLDQVERMADPSYDSRMRRVEKRMEKKTGQGFWWAPAQVTPERAPDPTSIAGR